jgi:hypothetical protein
MSFYIGKLTRHVSKNHNEYFDGVIGGIPVRGAWSKKANKPDNLCVFIDEEKVNFLSKKNAEKNKIPASAGTGAPEEKK